MHRYLLLFFVILFSNALGQNNLKDKIIGDWSAYLASGDSVTFHFNSDGSMYIKTLQGIMGNGEIIYNRGQRIKSLMRYMINTNAKPAQIDLYYAMDDYMNIVGKEEGILELLDDRMLRFAMNRNKPPIRPKNFDNTRESMVLTKLGEVIEVFDCEQFKKGQFSLNDPFIGKTTIIREGDLQIESNELGDKVRLRIEWTSNCTYTLKPIGFLTNNVWRPDTTGIIQTVQIIKVNPKSYIYSTGNNKTKSRITRELFKDKN